MNPHAYTAELYKVFAEKWMGRIYGATILGNHAGDMICEFAHAMRGSVSLRRMSYTIHPYPTFSQGNRHATDQWYVRNQSAFLVKLTRFLFGYHRPIPNLSDPNRIV